MTEHRRLADTNELFSAGPSADVHDGKLREEDPLLKEVRVTDLEPYTGLRYLSKLFRFMAVIMVLLLVAEVATGVYTQGSAALPTLLGEASRLIVIAGVLWGTGDLAHLLIDVGHDVRASRILLARVAHSTGTAPLVTDRARIVERASTERMLPRQTVVDLADRDGSGRGGS
ncbi:MAG: hypothetical protein ABI442_20475 [Gemmatimonadaceae bacterium]